MLAAASGRKLTVASWRQEWVESCRGKMGWKADGSRCSGLPAHGTFNSAFRPALPPLHAQLALHTPAHVLPDVRAE